MGGRERLAAPAENFLDLERASGIAIDREDWLVGFQLSIADLLINRFAMYTIVHRFRKQMFLERVVKTWSRLYRLFGMGA